MTRELFSVKTGGQSWDSKASLRVRLGKELLSVFYPTQRRSRLEALPLRSHMARTATMLDLGTKSERLHPRDAPLLDTATDYYLYHAEFKNPPPGNDHWGLILYPVGEVVDAGPCQSTGEGRLHHIRDAPRDDPFPHDLHHEVVEHALLRKSKDDAFKRQTRLGRIPGSVVREAEAIIRDYSTPDRLWCTRQTVLGEKVWGCQDWGIACLDALENTVRYPRLEAIVWAPRPPPATEWGEYLDNIRGVPRKWLAA